MICLNKTPILIDYSHNKKCTTKTLVATNLFFVGQNSLADGVSIDETGQLFNSTSFIFNLKQIKKLG